MRRRKATLMSCVRSSGRKGRGFTLAELIVVLAIIAILAAIGVASVVGYVKKSKYEQNTQNAITVYQTAQTAISQMSSNGSLDSWAMTLANGSERLNVAALSNINDSVHAAFYYTYNPGDENNPLYNLLYPYFYDKTIFNGTITVVFDVGATHGNLDKNTYSASVIGAFYSSQNPSSSNKNSAGWNTSYINTEKGNGNVAPWNELPCTDPSFRRNSSYVGYFDGTENSVYVPNKKIGPVVLPMTASFEMEGHIMGPTVDGTEATGYLFNLRNSETLDVSWAIFDFDYSADGGYYNGLPTVHDDHDETISILLRKDGVAYNDDVNTDDVRLSIVSDKLKAINWSSNSRTTYEDVDNFSLTKVTWDGFVEVTVKHGQTQLGTYKFPITKSLVTGDGRTGCPDPNYGYYEYRISLDSMMVRSDETDNNNLSTRYRISRLFGQNLYDNNNQNQTPLNIYAVLLPESDWTSYSLSGSSGPTLSATYAARSMDDPVYCTGTSVDDGIQYNYHVKDNAARYDDADSYTGDENQYKITGRCVVNTHFGDENYSTDPVSKKPVGGTSLTSESNNVTALDAVITSYRHLYNIRGINNSVVSTFRIVRDLDWYVHGSVTDNGENKEFYASEVKVFERGGSYNSPVANDGSLRVVSFPGLYELKSNHTLRSESASRGKVYSINNLQMRRASFRLGIDAGYGLVCKNSGTIVDIHTNNLNFALANCADGGNDLNSIFVNSVSVTSQKGGVGDLVNKNNDRPIGGLVGLNTSTGVIGQDNGSIVMSNSVVMGNRYWNIYGDVNKICLGGVIGKNESPLLGSIEINGAFAVVGRDNVGGIIGFSTADVGAKLLVNYTDAPAAEHTLPSYNNTALGENRMSSVIISKNCAGAAIGQLKGAALTASNDPFTYSSTPENGVFSDVDYDLFQVDVTLNTDSLIYMLGSYNAENESEKVAVGGAIGFMNTTNGTSAGIRVRNSGNIIVNDTSSDIYCGGVIGRDYDCSTTNVYIDFENNTGRIGYFTDFTGPLATGGAYGHIQCSRTGRTIAINGVNGGTLVSRGSGSIFNKGTQQAQGTGGVIGGVSRSDDNGVSIVFKINVENNTSSKILGNGENSDKVNGTGGAIGAMGNKDANESSTIPSGSVIYAVNNGTITGKYHVGGTIGDSVANYGQFYAVNNGSINGKDYVGGAVGRNAYSNYATIQAVLDGASIEGNSFVGGAVGKLDSQYDNALVKTIVRDSSTIQGLNTGSYVGGVCGQVVMTGSAINGIIELEGDGSAPTLRVEGDGSQIGGVAGQLFASNADNNAVVKTPSQNPGNRLVLKVSGADNVGGIIGKLNDNDQSKDINVDLSVAFLPGSSVEGSGKNVGGAVGYLVTKEGKNNYAGKINVSSVSDTTISGSCYIKGNNNVGGAVGQLYSCTSNINELDEIRVDFRYLKCDIEATGKGTDSNSNAGGAIGYCGCKSDVNVGSSNQALPIIAVLGNSNVIAADSSTGSTTYGNSVGGAIGYNSAKVGKISISSTGKIQGNNCVGGAIGYNKEATNCSAGDVTVEITNGSVIGNNDVGGAIGCNRAVSIGEITATVVGNVSGNGSRIGGVIGYNNTPLTQEITGKITGSVAGAGDDIGGVIGYNDVNISAAVNGTISGTVKGTSDASDNVAGGIGHTVNNTVSGVVSIVFTVNSGDQENKVQGVDNVGGIIGFNDGTAFSSSDGISSNIPAGFKIFGSGYVGGAVGNNSGTLASVKSVVNGSIFGTGTTGEVGGAIGQNNTAVTTVIATLGSNAKIQSSGNCVGGAIGENKANISTIQVNSSGIIEGSGKTGGAIGQNTGTLNSIDVTLDGKVSGTGNDGEVGGAIGYNEAVINGTTIVALKGEVFAGIRDDDGSLSTSYDNVGGAIGHSVANSCSDNIIVTFSGNGKVEGGNNIGGIIGFNEKTSLNVNLTCIIPVNCSVRGYGNNGRIGGAIGYNDGALNTVTVIVHGVVGSVNGGNVGGAIGFNYNGKVINKVETTITGLITSVSKTTAGNIVNSYDNVGGAIGYCIDTNYTPTNTINTITTNLQGNAVIEGNDNVGGAVGYCENNAENITANITGNSKIKGGSRVGGAIGWSCAQFGTSSNYYGDVVFSGKCTGKIKNVTAVISADYALSGDGSCIGGVVGKSGDKEGSRFSSCVLQTVTVEINSRYLFDPSSTGTDSTEAACIGGAVGILAEGRIDKVVMRGTGGAVNLGSDSFGSEYTYEGPRVSISGAVLIAAKGKSVGGIVGQIGLDGYTAADNQNVSLATIDVTKAPQLCVVSVNGSDGIGGWIGKGQGRRGGIGNRTNSKTTYDVTNVKLVYSQGSDVGGFCGRSIGYHTTAETFAAFITVTLDDANIIGKSGVGGAFGSLNHVYFSGGEIIINLNGRTNIGDISGNALPGDNTSYSPICYEAGGAIGRFDMQQYGKSFVAPIKVYFNGSLSRVYAGGGSGYQSDYGVGGVIGSFVNNSSSFKSTARLIIEPSIDTDPSSSNLLVFSENSNAGGVIGYISNSQMSNYSSTDDCYAKNLTVQVGSNGGAVGGFVGKVTNNNNKTIKFCRFDGTVLAGENSYAGGFVGYAYNMGTNGIIDSCYTTAIVDSTGSATGGFAGCVQSGKIQNCYVGGHTYQGQYVAGEGNISGADSVGGFVGYTTETNTFNNCYSTASVYGTGSDVGGFVGNRSDSSTLTDCYCTGAVTGSVNEGAFAGNSKNTKYTRCYVLDGINDGMPLIGSLNIEGNNGTLNFADEIYINRKGNTASATTYTASPFDSSLGSTYPLRAVIINKTHVGDWGIPVGGADKISIVNAEITLLTTRFEYRKDGVTLGKNDISVVAYDENGDPQPLEYGVDYTLSYKNNTTVGDATVTIAGVPDRGYVGVVNRTFTIHKVNIRNASVVITSTQYDEQNTPLYDYTGSAIVPTTVVTINGDTLVLNKDYYLTYDNGSIDGENDNNNIDLGTVTVTVVGMGNYENSADMKGTFKILGMNILNANITLTGNTAAELVYDGNAKEPGIIVRIGGQTRIKDVDYTVTYENNTNAGTATITITGQGILRGTRTENFTITTADNSWITEPSINGWTWNPFDDSVAQSPVGEARFGTVEYLYYVDENCTTLTDSANSGASEEGGQPVNAGTYYLKAFVERYENEDANGHVGYWLDSSNNKHYNYNYKDKIIAFTILPYNIASSAVVTIDPDEYCVTGSAIIPDSSRVTVKVNSDDQEQILNSGADYSVRYINNTNVGEANIIVEGNGNYTGTCRGTFTIREPIVTFDSVGGSEIDPSELSIVYGRTVSRPEDPVRESGTDEYSWRFDGWYDNEAYEGETYNFSSAVKSDITLFAKWVKQYTVTFCATTDENADNPPAARTVLIDEGSKVSEPSDVAWAGLTLEGWYKNDPLIPVDPETDPSETELYDFDAPVEENLILYAKWQATVSFVIVNKEANEQNPEALVLDYNSTGEIEKNQLYSPLAIRERTESGKWIYDGWYLDEECKLPYDSSAVITHDITLYTKWTKVIEVKYIISESESYSVPVYIGSAADEPVTPTSEVYPNNLYDFVGWFKEDGITPVSFGVQLYADQIYYAKWVEKEFELSFDSNGGTGTMDAVQVTSVTGVQIPANSFAKEGCNFSGWATDPNATIAEYSDNETITLTENTIFYAVWTS